MNYFYYEPNKNLALEVWGNSQFALADIVLSLTDNRIVWGGKIYSVFCRDEVLNIIQYFVCDFVKIKQDLGVGNYVKREGNVYNKYFNPKRNIDALKYTKQQMEQRAKVVYKNIMQDLYYIGKLLTHN